MKALANQKEQAALSAACSDLRLSWDQIRMGMMM